MCSAVWNAFTKSECGTRATCDICFKGYSNSGNTTNLWNHLSSTHKAEYHELRNSKKKDQNNTMIPENDTLE